MSKQVNTEQFIAKARSIHGSDHWDYSKVEYTKATVKIEIVCPEHGSFWQLPHAHLAGQGCPSCNAATRGDSTDIFLVKARALWGDKFGHRCGGSNRTCDSKRAS